MKSLVVSIVILLGGFALLGCAPKVGSDEWCEAMEEKPKGDWTANELGDFTKHCIIK